MKEAILQEFDNWNQGYDIWNFQTENFYSDDVVYHTDTKDMSLAEYIESEKEASETTTVKRVSFDSMILSGDWAAIHYRTTNTDTKTG